MHILRVIALILSSIPTVMQAQDRANTILVMDGSGSMWGQIDGINKIVIAREVVGQILQDFPADQNLGLTVYGHRERGNCADIETIVAPEIGTSSAILDAVNAINPRGKTPMTDAIIAAAEALRYTEEAATVILVSDGIETCNPDPCAAARALEQAGIDFTAHVVGFDVTEADALAQMQCLAEETGGRFLTASNAQELADALETVAVADPVVETYPVTFVATRGEGGPEVTFDMLWDIADPDGLLIDANTDTRDGMLVFQDGTATLDLAPSSYNATAYGVSEDISGSSSFQVNDNAVTVTIVLPAALPDATLQAPATAPLGSIVAVSWTGPNDEGDYIGVSDPEDGLNTYVNYAYTADGNPAMIELPPQAAGWELRYFSGPTGQVLAVANISTTPVEVSLDAAGSAEAGASIPVSWTGPDYDLDYISVARPDDSSYENYAYTRDGSPAMLEMPVEPGDYELRYVLRQDSTVIATRPITVTNVQAALDAAETATVGQPVEVTWTGPDYDQDFIAVAEPGARGYINYTYTRDGNPLLLAMPTEPGTYELRYTLRQDQEVIATRPITVIAAESALIVPDTAIVGETITVGWTGPDYDQDFIAVGEPGARGYINYTYTRDGNPLGLVMPTEPGTYELRYTLRQDNEIIATRPITVTALKVELAAPDEAIAGSTVPVTWEGPDYEGDFIAVGETGENRYINYAYTRDGTPAQLLMPVEPGDYEIRYTLRQDNAIVQRIPITITAVTANLIAEPTVPLSAGTIIVGWDGPDYDADFIGISQVGEGGYERYAYTRDGNPVTVRLPETPGDYELRYFLRQDNTVIATRPLTVTAD